MLKMPCKCFRGVAASLQAHHGAFIAESAIEAAVNLSIRYLPSRQLPDKAISLDTASARIALTLGMKPEVLETLGTDHSPSRKREIGARERRRLVLE